MIEPGKLNTLSPGQKRRKLALSFGALERDIEGIAEAGCGYSFRSMTRADYVRRLVGIVAADDAIPAASREELRALASAEPFGVEEERRACNAARHALLAALGSFPAEWDLIIAPHGGAGFVEERRFFGGMCVYAEDIRSPFNVGSIFRTAEAMGAERVILSPGCVDPLHPKSLRSGMGCVETMGFERKSVGELSAFAEEGGLPVFVLETGGTPILDFEFPRRGICVVGSEELGVSPEALRAATYGRVSIPMTGLKASLNVGVAFGILMQKWGEALAGGASD